MSVILGVSGATGAALASRFIEYVYRYNKDLRLHVITTPNALLNAKVESSIDLNAKLNSLALRHDIVLHDNADLTSPLASGSYNISSMLVLPTSMQTLSAIALGLCDSLLTRAAFVSIKEKRRLVLAPREMPLPAIALSHMLELAKQGVMIAPPMLGYYPNIQSLEAMETLLFGRYCDFLGLLCQYERWGGDKNCDKVD